MVLLLLIFQNLFNAYSPYVTLALNLAVALAVLFRHVGRIRKAEPVVLSTTYFVLAWVMLVLIYRGEPEWQIVLKYIRSALAVSLFFLIFAVGRISSTAIVRAVGIALAFHVMLVLVQIAVPDLTRLTAPFFGFEQDLTIIDDYALRKLGASSSYDTASLFSIAALLFFSMQFARGKGSRYLILTIAAFAATLMSSRTGIALSLLIVSVIFLRMLLDANLKRKAVAITGMTILLVFAYKLIFPLLLHSLGIAELRPEDAGLFFAATDYGTTGTLNALTDEHLQPLAQPLMDLFIGYAVDPNTIARYTDIGYVKLIYHVGIVGTAAILFAHLYMLVATRKIFNRAATGSDRELVSRFLFWLIAVSIVFNYKSLELHSRGIGDFIYMIFLFIAQSYEKSRGALTVKRQSTP